MITCEQHIRPHSEVVDTTLDSGDVVLLHLDHKTYYSLNATGAYIWQGVKDGLTMRAISQQLQARYAVEPDHADRSVLALVEDLLQHQLVQCLEA
jgi:coenzyme PQQ synthesis protein D (PqqD)